MDRVLPTIPISELRKKLTQVLPMLNTSPVVLMNRGDVAGVLVQADQWNQTADELKRLRRIIEGDKQLAEIRAGNYTELPPAAVIA